MADRAERYAKWIIANKDKKGTPEFETVAQGYRAARNEQKAPQAPQTVSGQRNAERSVSPLDRAQGLAESGATVVSGLASSAAGGLAGLASLPFVGPEQAASNVQSIQEAGTYQPRGELGGKYVQNTVEALNTPLAGYAGLAELLAGNGLDSAVNTIEQAQEVGAGKVAGNKVLEATGSPALATAAELTPDIAGALLSVKGINALRRGDEVTPNLNRAAETASNKINQIKIPDIQGTARKQEIAKRIQSGDTSGDLAEYRIKEPKVWERLAETSKPQSEKDPKAIAAIKQGFDKGVISSVKNAISSSPTNRLKMKQMVELKRKGIDNQEFATVNRPSNVAGKSVGDMAREVEKKRRYAGSELNKVAKDLQKYRLDVSDEVKAFTDALEGEHRITLEIDENGLYQPNFAKSNVYKDKSSENIVNNIVERMRDVDLESAYDVHTLKQYIYNQVNYGRRSEGGLAGGIEVRLKELAESLDSKLDSTFPVYRRVNEQYAAARKAIDSLEKLADSDLDLKGPYKDINYGILLRRTMSNAQSAPRLMKALKNIQEVANSKNFDLLDLQNPGKFKGKTFNDNLIAQALFVHELDVMFKPAARTSMEGIMQRGAGTAIEANENWLNTAVRFGAKGFDRARGVNEENAFKAIKDLLDEG